MGIGDCLGKDLDGVRLEWFVRCIGSPLRRFASDATDQPRQEELIKGVDPEIKEVGPQKVIASAQA